MKLVSLAIAGVAATATEKVQTPLGSIVSRRLDGMMTADLELATKTFFQSNLRMMSHHPSYGGKRTLRSHTRASDREMTDDTVYSKSGKSGGMSSDDLLFYLLPADCPNECISSHVDDGSEMIDSVKICEDGEPTQMWLVRSDGSYIMVESYDMPGMCISVDYQVGDNDAMVAQECENGVLVLRDCHSVYGTEWYFTGGQLVNSLCWAAGLPSMMTVGIKNANEYTCEKDVSVYGKMGEVMLKADTFMFVNRLPLTPFYISDVSAALVEKAESLNDDKPAKQPKSVISHFEGNN